MSRGLTQFVNPGAPLSASLLSSLLCRAEPDPLPGWEWGWGGSRSGGEGGTSASTGAPTGDAGDGEQGGGGGEVTGCYGGCGGHRPGTGLAKEQFVCLRTCLGPRDAQRQWGVRQVSLELFF